MKMYLLLAVMAFVCGAQCLDCYMYVVNDYNGLPELDQPPASACPGNETHCATLSWTSVLSTNEKVRYQEGLCTTYSVCTQFCNTLAATPTLKTPQCQQQCCTGEGCNKFHGMVRL
ncbi:uncharacterized protein LOC100178404 [Ciona intestinalis]